MGIIGFILGVIFFLLAFVLIERLIKKIDKYKTSKIYELANNYRTGNVKYLSNKWAEFFKDENYMRGFSNRVTFKYYGGTWQLNGVSELYWVNQSFRGIKEEEPEYKSDWNYWRNDFKSMKYIMENHPNLDYARKKLKLEDKIPKIIE
jgi:hypothetical protein